MIENLSAISHAPRYGSLSPTGRAARMWPAEDETTAELMVRLFQRMRETPDTPLSDALRLAQLSVIDQAKGSARALRSHPFLWGAFTVVGDGVKTASGF